MKGITKLRRPFVTRTVLRVMNMRAIQRGFLNRLDPLYIETIPEERIMPVVTYQMIDHRSESSIGIYVELLYLLTVQVNLRSGNNLYIACTHDAFENLPRLTNEQARQWPRC